MDITISLITTLVLTLINGYFSMSEMALTTAKRAVLEHEAEEGDKRAERAIKLAAETPGPVYVRMGRASVPCVYEPGKELEMGRAYVLREGGDVSIVACGVEIDEALKAAELLAAEGISAEVIDAFCVKPLDEDTILASVEKTGCIVTAEEHSVIGGLGGAVAECLAAKHPAPLERVGMQDCFGTSASYEELLVEFHMDAAAIAEAAKKAISRK